MSAVRRLADQPAAAVSTVAGADAHVAFSGTLDVMQAAAARSAVAESIGPRTATLTVDLSDVDRLDAAGLAGVTAPVMSARRLGIAVAVVPPRTGEARRVADQTGVLALLATVR